MLKDYMCCNVLWPDPGGSRPGFLSLAVRVTISANTSNARNFYARLRSNNMQ